MLRIQHKRLLVASILFISMTLLYCARRTPFKGRYVSTRTYNHLQHNNIPKIIYQTWGNTQIPYPKAQQSWKDLNMNHTYEFYTDDQSENYVKERFPDIYPLYKRLPNFIMRVDLFRYLVVYDKGGIYADIDTKCLKPIDVWRSKFPDETINVIIGVEFDGSDHIVPWFSNVQLQFLQWTFASAPRHPMIQHVINTIQYKYTSMSEEELSKTSVHDTTGPSIWSKAILDYLCLLDFCSLKSLQWLDEPVLVDDVLILPPTSFNPFSDMRGKGIDHEWSFVQHKFLGSWK